jgi:hypothetical protein
VAGSDAECPHASQAPPAASDRAASPSASNSRYTSTHPAAAAAANGQRKQQRLERRDGAWNLRRRRRMGSRPPPGPAGRSSAGSRRARSAGMPCRREKLSCYPGEDERGSADDSVARIRHTVEVLGTKFSGARQCIPLCSSRCCDAVVVVKRTERLFKTKAWAFPCPRLAARLIGFASGFTDDSRDRLPPFILHKGMACVYFTFLSPDQENKTKFCKK